MTFQMVSEYGIEIHEDVVSGDDYSTWSEDELRAILTGAMRIGEAYTQASVAGNTRQDRFISVMISGGSFTHMRFVRLATNPTNTAWRDYYYGTANALPDAIKNGVCGNIAPEAATGRPRTIACRGYIDNGDMNPRSSEPGRISEFTATHELGHLFDNRTGDPILENALHTQMENQEDVNGAVIYACDGKTVIMGVHGGRWKRGGSGWGTPGWSDFQQNLGDDPEITEVEKLAEVAADMYLNWVYRITSDDPPSPDCTVPDEAGTWQGFRNIDREGNADNEFYDDEGVLHQHFSGNVRYQWMDNMMNFYLEDYKD